jgi:hypothetical protein
MKPEFSMLGRFRRSGSQPKPQRPEDMPRYKYVGKEPENVAQIGRVKNGDIVTVSTEIGDALERNDPEQWELVREPVNPPKPITPTVAGGTATKPVEQPRPVRPARPVPTPAPAPAAPAPAPVQAAPAAEAAPAAPAADTPPAPAEQK